MPDQGDRKVFGVRIQVPMQEALIFSTTKSFILGDKNNNGLGIYVTFKRRYRTEAKIT